MFYIFWGILPRFGATLSLAVSRQFAKHGRGILHELALSWTSKSFRYGRKAWVCMSLCVCVCVIFELVTCPGLVGKGNRKHVICLGSPLTLVPGSKSIFHAWRAHGLLNRTNTLGPTKPALPHSPPSKAFSFHSVRICSLHL